MFTEIMEKEIRGRELNVSNVCKHYVGVTVKGVKVRKSKGILNHLIFS